MTLSYGSVAVGARFGSLTVVSIGRGAKNKSPTTDCLCDCGGTRKVRPSALRKGRVYCCATCSLRRAWDFRERNHPHERKLLSKETEYRSRARTKGFDFSLSRSAFRSLYAAGCRYCGTTPAEGIDRRDNASGYTEKNSVSCCAMCNFAKRTASEAEFLVWLAKAYEHSIKGGIFE